MIPERRCHCGAELDIRFSDSLDGFLPTAIETCVFCGLPPDTCRCPTTTPNVTVVGG